VAGGPVASCLLRWYPEQVPHDAGVAVALHRSHRIGDCAQLCVMLLFWVACSSALPRGVVQHPPGARLSHIDGPMTDVGSFLTYSDALLAACPLLLNMPNAVANRPGTPNFQLHWELSQEYCAWIYYTPDETYELSMLMTSRVQDDPRRRRCDLPSYVRDPRYSDEQIGYLFVVHNHPTRNELSRDDIRFIVDQGRIHGFTVQAKDHEIPIGIVAFFSNSPVGESATCDGFFVYVPLTGEIQRWATDEKGAWKKEVIRSVKWLNSTEFEIQ
jgi:hypothetical protein